MYTWNQHYIHIHRGTHNKYIVYIYTHTRYFVYRHIFYSCRQYNICVIGNYCVLPLILYGDSFLILRCFPHGKHEYSAQQLNRTTCKSSEFSLCNSLLPSSHHTVSWVASSLSPDLAPSYQFPLDSTWVPLVLCPERQ